MRRNRILRCDGRRKQLYYACGHLIMRGNDERINCRPAIERKLNRMRAQNFAILRFFLYSFQFIIVCYIFRLLRRPCSRSGICFGAVRVKNRPRHPVRQALRRGCNDSFTLYPNSEGTLSSLKSACERSWTYLFLCVSNLSSSNERQSQFWTCCKTSSNSLYPSLRNDAN